MVERFNEPVIVFLTVCARDRQRLLAAPEVVTLLRDSWHAAEGWLVGRYVVMPDHVHLFCAPAACHGIDGAMPSSEAGERMLEGSALSLPRLADRTVSHPGTDGAVPSRAQAGLPGTDGAVPSKAQAGLPGTDRAVPAKAVPSKLAASDRAGSAPSLGRWVRYWKTLASRRWPRPAEQPVWQLDFWDTQLRSVAHYDEKWEYVRRNPVRAGLVADTEAWPYQGELHELRW